MYSTHPCNHYKRNLSFPATTTSNLRQENTQFFINYRKIGVFILASLFHFQLLSKENILKQCRLVKHVAFSVFVRYFWWC